MKCTDYIHEPQVGSFMMPELENYIHLFTLNDERLLLENEWNITNFSVNYMAIDNETIIFFSHVGQEKTEFSNTGCSYFMKF